MHERAFYKTRHIYPFIIHLPRYYNSYPAIIGDKIYIQGNILYGVKEDNMVSGTYPAWKLSDHRINLTLYSLDRVVEGEIEELVTALREHDIELRLASQLEDKASG